MTEALEKPAVAFPSGYAEVLELNGNLADELRVHDAEIKRRQARIELVGTVQGIIYALLTSWKEADPGKRSLSVSFVDRGKYRVAVQEFLPPDTKQFTKEEWRKASPQERLEGLRPGQRVIPFAEVRLAECPGCHEQHPVLEWYRQVYDGPGGDEWLKRHILLCGRDASEPQIHELGRWISGTRF